MQMQYNIVYFHYSFDYQVIFTGNDFIVLTFTQQNMGISVLAASVHVFRI